MVRPGDPERLAGVLLELGKAPEKRGELGGHGRLAAKTRFDRKLIANDFIDFLESNL